MFTWVKVCTYAWTPVQHWGPLQANSEDEQWWSSKVATMLGSLGHSRRTLWEGRGLMEMNVNTSRDNPNSSTILSQFVVWGSLTYVDLLKVQCKWDHGLFPRSPWAAPLTLTRLITGTGCGSQGAYNVGIPHLSLIPYQRQWIDHINIPKYSYTINVIQRGGFKKKKKS